MYCAALIQSMMSNVLLLTLPVFVVTRGGARSGVSVVWMLCSASRTGGEPIKLDCVAEECRPERFTVSRPTLNSSATSITANTNKVQASHLDSLTDIFTNRNGFLIYCF